MREYAEFELRAQLAKANGQYETCMAPILSCGQYAAGETIAGAGGATVLAADCCFEPKIFIGIRGVMTDGKAHSARLRPTLVCGAGNMPDGNTLADACKPCPAGTEKPLGQKMCTPCPAGSAAENKGTARCSRCKPGRSSGSAGRIGASCAFRGGSSPALARSSASSAPSTSSSPSPAAPSAKNAPMARRPTARRCRPRIATAPRAFCRTDVVGKNAEAVEKQQNLRLQNGLPCVACADLPLVGPYATCPGSCPSARGNPAKGCAGDVTIEPKGHSKEARPRRSQTLDDWGNAIPWRGNRVHGASDDAGPKRGLLSAAALAKGDRTALEATGRMAQADKYYPFLLPDDYGALVQANLEPFAACQRGSQSLIACKGGKWWAALTSDIADQSVLHSMCGGDGPRQGGGELHPLAAVR